MEIPLGENERIGRVVSEEGANRVKVILSDGNTYEAVLRGNVQNAEWAGEGSYVVVEERSFSTQDVVDVNSVIDPDDLEESDIEAFQGQE